MIEIKPGDLVMETSTGRIGKLQNIKLTPTGINNPELCVILYVSMETEGKGRSVLSATADKFQPVDDENYTEFYPTVEACRISDILAATTEN